MSEEKKPRKPRETKPKTEERQDHTVVDGDTLKCLRCGETDKMPVNVSVDYLIKRIQLFVGEHQDCQRRKAE